MMDNQQQQQQLLGRRNFLKLAASFGGAALALSSMRLFSYTEANAAPKNNKSCTQEVFPVLSAYNAANTIGAKTFDNLTTVEGISQNQLNQHLGLYQGYVKKINEIDSLLKTAVPDVATMNGTYSMYRELHAEQTFALNGVILHEYYFENMGGTKTQPSNALKQVIVEEFATWDNYINHLMAVARSARGWAITGYNMRDKRIHNYLLDSHNQMVPVNVIPLLVLDVYEHAYMIDFGTKRPAYLDAFAKNINWSVVEQRLDTMLWHTAKKK